MHHPATIERLHREQRIQRVADLLTRVANAPNWVRKSLHDDSRRPAMDMLRQAQWHERTAASHDICADTLRALYEISESDPEGAREFAKALALYPAEGDVVPSDGDGAGL